MVPLAFLKNIAYSSLNYYSSRSSSLIWVTDIHGTLLWDSLLAVYWLHTALGSYRPVQFVAQDTVMTAFFQARGNASWFQISLVYVMDYFLKEIIYKPGTVVHTLNSSTPEAGGTLWVQSHKASFVV